MFSSGWKIFLMRISLLECARLLEGDFFLFTKSFFGVTIRNLFFRLKKFYCWEFICLSVPGCCSLDYLGFWKLVKDKVLKTVTLPSKVNSLMRRNFKIIPLILTIFSQKWLSCSRFLLCEKWSWYFHGFVMKINTFHAAECHLNPIQNSNTHNITFFLIWF